MEDKEVMMTVEADTKRKRDELARGRRKCWKEDDIRLEKHEHSPMVSHRVHETQQDSIQRTGMSFNKKKMIGR